MRVLELIKGLDLGGAETLLAERLGLGDRTRFEYRVAYLDPRRDGLVTRLEGMGIPVWSLGARSRLDLRWLWGIRRYLVRERVDVVHVHSPLMAALVRLVVRSLGRRRPAVVTTEHSFDYHPLSRFAARATVAMDDLTIAVSDAVAASDVSRHARNLVVIHHGVNVKRLKALREHRAALAAELGLPDGPLVVTVANYRPEKGHATLLAAARLVHARRPEVRFVVVGHGPTREAVLGEVAAHGMEDYFHALGGSPDAVRWTACADVFVLPSDREGRPVALMEAVACGVPTVATRVGGVPDVLGEGAGGLLVPPASPEAMAEGILQVLGSPALQRDLATATVGAGDGLDLQDAAGRIEEIYEQLAAGVERRSRP